MLYAVSEYVERMEGEEPFTTSVRFRTVGDMTCTGGVESTRVDDRRRSWRRSRRRASPSAARRAPTTAFSEAAMEDSKRVGYF